MQQNADCDIETCELERVICCYGQVVGVWFGLGLIFVFFFTILRGEGLRLSGGVGWGLLIYLLLLNCGWEIVA